MLLLCHASSAYCHAATVCCCAPYCSPPASSLLQPVLLSALPQGTADPAADLPAVCSEQSRTPAAGIAGHVHKYGQQEYEARAIFVHSVALVMLTVSIGMAVYATFNFRQRMSWLA